MAAQTLPDQAYLRECFEYAPDTGVLRWRARPLHHFSSERQQKATNTRFAGKPIRGGKCCADGYVRFGLNRGAALAHRVIWKWMTGDDVPEVDHRDQNPSNNR